VCRAAGGSRALRFLKDSFCPQINHGNQKSGSLDTRTDNHFGLDMVRKAAFWDGARRNPGDHAKEWAPEVSLSFAEVPMSRSMLNSY